MRDLILILLSILTFWSCKNYNEIGSGNELVDSVSNTNEALGAKGDIFDEKGILFLHFMLYADKGNGYKVKSTEVQMVDGAMQERDLQQNKSAIPGNLYFSFKDSEKKELKSTQLENPLIQRVEFSEDGKNIQSKIIEKDSAYFFLRTNHSPEVSFLEISLINSSGEKEPIEVFNFKNLLERRQK